MTGNSVEFTKNLLIKVVGEDRKYKTFKDNMYVSLGNNKVAYIEMGFPTVARNYGCGSISINVFDKNHGKIDSISIDFNDVCKDTDLERSSRNYFVDCNGTGWYTNPPEEFFNLVHNEIESYLEIFEESF